ncbi:IucA/IucC family protein [Paenibacillus lautus]|uniref:IucA/IucC family protein n=1 Tax=Paenibacillus lautus TaxID=1401 RepID=UPI001C7D4535|nr:IucA/IucC family protein [Paenibacillus lautus]MBX4149101.1 short-chain oxidoreductase [Paenibacillus lautus]
MLKGGRPVATALAELRRDAVAERIAARSLLNAFIRENVQLIKDPHALAFAAQEGGAVPFALQLSDGSFVHGKIRYASLTGQHVYEDGWVLERGGTLSRLPFDLLAETLVQELVQRLPTTMATAERVTLKRIRCSLRQLRGHLEQRAADERIGRDVRRLDYVTSEQSVFAGHPFHPYPKCVEGMDESELHRFSPERGSSFALHYFAVREALLLEEWLTGEKDRSLPDATWATFRRMVMERLGPGSESVYEPLPMHPWQAEHFMSRPWVVRAIRHGDVVPLGPIGPVVYPTSSVRTAWDPESGCGWKLPLETRITNLTRVNSAEQTIRTIHAGRLAVHLGQELKRELPGLLPETGYMGMAASEEMEMIPSATVLYRPMAFHAPATFVLASLLESWPGEQTPKLAQAIAENVSGDVLSLPDMQTWLERYLKLSMLPLLRVWERFGISFEAHAQNSLLTLEKGWPSRFYVRDLEGMSVDRELAAKSGWIGAPLPEDSPLLYDAPDAWHRTLYYFFVNHIGSLIHALALSHRRPEREGWDVVRRMLLELRHQAGDRLRPYVDGLLNEPSLPAKANFMSCLAGKGDKPMYISINNPIWDGRS